ncbi:MAG: PSD1 and planctomycete cytochrome C domain-containing protein [Gemmataceae bacterium]
MLRPAVALLAMVAVQPLRAADPDPKAVEFFEAKIRPVLVKHCYACHSAEAQTKKKLKAGLRLDRKDHVLKGGESGPALVPGDAKKSLLIQVLKAEGSERMPPDKPLPAAVIADFEKWIQDGAFDPRTGADESSADIAEAKNHWAFQPLRNAGIPAGRNAIDHFIQSRLRENGVSPAPLADRRTLLRRAAFDLTGLPPTPEEAEAFLKDESPEAYAKLIERLLASRHYGEKWGRHWLDVVRYADTAGETADFPLPEAWRYRNYVIDAFNADKPFDRFIKEQLAGDILARTALASERPALLAATGYLAISRRFGFDVRADHFLTIEDTIDTLGKSFLGLTIGCSRCHDHKYDPIPMTDYYALYGVFESTRFAMPGCEKDKRQHDLVPVSRNAELAMLGGMTTRDSVYGVMEGSPHDAQLHKRGDPETRGIVVPRRWLTVFGAQALPKESGSGRLQLAEWIADPKNPLTARVLVNRVWQYHFGRGLVSTPNDFGTRGAKPSHPELLDELTAEFIRSGWSVKQLHRRIMLTETYRRSTEAAADRDTANTWLGRFSRRRLTAEEIRDSILGVSGDLDPTPGTRHPFPAENTWNFTQHAPFLAVYEHDKRSVYLMSQRIKRHPFLALFDGADPNRSTDRRETTTVPTQALYFLNDPFVHAKSAKLAARIVKLRESERIDALYLRMFNRKPTADERAIAGKFLGEGLEQNWAAWIRVLFASNEFLYVD